MYEHLLEDIGLTKSEVKVYEALLEIGSSSTGKIVDNAHVASSKVYEILERLIQKGLASFVISSGVKYFEAADPKRILDYLAEKESLLNKQKKDIEAILPELQLKKEFSADKSETQVFKGMKGAQTAFEDILKTLKPGEELVIIGFSGVHLTFQQFLSKFHKRRAKEKIKCRMLLGGQVKALHKTLDELPYTQVKKTPPDEERPVAMLIYKDTSLFSLAEDNIWIQVKNKRLADAFRTNFEQLWNKDTYILKGLDAIENLFNEILEYDNADFFAARGYFFEKRKEFIKDWARRAEEKGFKLRNIIDSSNKNHEISKLPFAKTKYNLPKEIANMSVYWIFGNKVAIANWIGEEPIIVVIENEEFYKLYKQQFEELWNTKKVLLSKAKRTTHA